MKRGVIFAPHRVFELCKLLNLTTNLINLSFEEENNNNKVVVLSNCPLRSFLYSFVRILFCTVLRPLIEMPSFVEGLNFVGVNLIKSDCHN